MIDSSLLRHIGGYVAGGWVSGDESFGVLNPATGDELARVPEMGGDSTHLAIDSAAQAIQQPVPIDRRRQWLDGLYELLMSHKEDLAKIITLEQGKPLKESRAEVEYAAGFFRFFAEQLQILAPHHLPRPVRNLQWTIHHRPAGVVGLITPWNFPLAMLAKKLAPAMAAGCGIIAKPAELTPLTAIALWNLMQSLEIPPGWVNLVVGQPKAIGEAMFAHPAVRLISFTGSTETGRILIHQSAAHIKRLSLELGGNAPYLVMDDADIVLAADALMANKFRCAGQTCVCANRILVHRNVEQAFTRAVVERVGRLRTGDGMDSATDIGPLINRAAVEKVNRHVEDAIRRGAKLAVRNQLTADRRGNFYAPTVLNNVTEEAQMFQEETFGPVVPIATFDSDEQALRMANSTPYGLAAYVFSRSHDRADFLVNKLNFGHVGVNTGMGPTPETPFGGMKQSGFGREGGIEGLLEYTEAQTVPHL
ncbi:MAG TPA: NAD-dependent succinate-semialdehyde dehydrogenase [Tepidisphaeraceae bacterium]|nr:NAD-dependent succinate-semialdehyde dehydrogenase [Tepidisphaeraceae bacterium]